MDNPIIMSTIQYNNLMYALKYLNIDINEYTEYDFKDINIVVNIMKSGIVRLLNKTESLEIKNNELTHELNKQTNLQDINEFENYIDYFEKHPDAKKDKCSICCDKYTNQKLICKHEFCNICLSNLIQPKCPLCRTDIIKSIYIKNFNEHEYNTKHNNKKRKK